MVRFNFFYSLAASQVLILQRRLPRYEEPEVNVDKLETLNFENTALFLVSSFQYILVAAGKSLSHLFFIAPADVSFFLFTLSSLQRWPAVSQARLDQL